MNCNTNVASFGHKRAHIGHKWTRDRVFFRKTRNAYQKRLKHLIKWLLTRSTREWNEAGTWAEREQRTVDSGQRRVTQIIRAIRVIRGKTPYSAGQHGARSGLKTFFAKTVKQTRCVTVS